MTRKLYYEDSYQDVFEAVVVVCEQVENGYKVILDQTAFYPGGGGQPSDRGTLNGIDVVAMGEDGEMVYHIVSEAFEVGQAVAGQVYIEKRIDYMVQHTGEHLLSGILHEWFGYSNVGFYMSESYMTADFDGELTKQQMDMLELKANDAIQANVPVAAKVYHMPNVPAYRAKLQFEDDVRLVEVEGYDCCACCGTHIYTTGDIGILKIVGYEKHRGGCRLTILCGRRAVYDYQARFDELAEVSGLLSAKVGQVGQAVGRLQEELSRVREQRYLQDKKYLEEKASAYPKDRPLLMVEEKLHMDELKLLADAVANVAKEPTLIVVPEANGFKYVMIHPTQDIRAFCKDFNSVVEGKGGGKPHLCQGSAKGSIEEAKAYFYKAFPSWVEQILSYEPYNEQEVAAKRIFSDYINRYDNTLERENELAHITSSGWIVNKERTKVLMIHHNLYNKWAWTGGHNDGDSDMLGVAIREAIEETGIQTIKVVQEGIFALDVLPVWGHIKRGKYVATHMHLSVAFLLEADEEETLTVKPDENSGVMWVPVEEVHNYTDNEPDRILYGKFMDKIADYQL